MVPLVREVGISRSWGKLENGEDKGKVGEC